MNEPPKPAADLINDIIRSIAELEGTVAFDPDEHYFVTPNDLQEILEAHLEDQLPTQLELDVRAERERQISQGQTLAKDDGYTMEELAEGIESNAEIIPLLGENLKACDEYFLKMEAHCRAARESIQRRRVKL